MLQTSDDDEEVALTLIQIVNHFINSNLAVIESSLNSSQDRRFGRIWQLQRSSRFWEADATDINDHEIKCRFRVTKMTFNLILNNVKDMMRK